MRATRSRKLAALLAAVGAGFAVSAMIGAPAAVAQDCEPGQVVIDNQCNVPDNNVPAPPQDGSGMPGMGGGMPGMDGGGSGMDGGGHGR